MTRPPSNALPQTREAARLGAFARGLGLSVGIERSCKFAAGRADANRFLLSFAADARTGPAMAALLHELSFPPAWAAQFDAAAAEANFLHLGYEEAASGPVLKAYCEGEPGAEDRSRLYTAFKWSAHDRAGAAVDDYWLRDLDLAAMQIAITEAFTAPHEPLARACNAVLDGAYGAVSAEDAMFLEVERRGAARRSFDLRLYGAGIRLVDARPLAMQVGVLLGLGQDAWSLLAGHGTSLLGHLSGGRDAAGGAFVTLYFGAEDFA